MAGIRKRTWKTKDGVKSCYEVTYYINDKLYRKSGYKTKLKAQKDLNNITQTITTQMTFKELSDEFLARHCRIHCKESTIYLYENYLKTRLACLLKRKVTQITPRDISNLLFQFLEDGLSKKTINNILIFLKSIFNYGIDNELLSKNPAEKIKKIPLGKKQINFLSEEQVEVFLKVTQKFIPSHYALFYTAINTGMRRGELLGLNWSDIDFKKKKININKQWYMSKLSSTKTNTSTRIICISDNLCNVLYEHKKQAISNIVFSNAQGEHQHAWNMTERYFKKVLKIMLTLDNIEKLNLENLRFHDLRHTYASLMLSKGAPIKFVQEQMGHASCKVTLDTYNHVMPKESELARNLLDNVFSKCEHNMSIAN